MLSGLKQFQKLNEVSKKDEELEEWGLKLKAEKEALCKQMESQRPRSLYFHQLLSQYHSNI